MRSGKGKCFNRDVYVLYLSGLNFATLVNKKIKATKASTMYVFFGLSLQARGGKRFAYLIQRGGYVAYLY